MGDRKVTKTCTKCKQEKDVNEFYHADRCKDGVRGACKECRKVQTANYRKTHPDKIKEGKKKWYAKNGLQYCTEKRQAYKNDPTKANAQSRKSKYGITEEEFQKLLTLQGGVCACCGRPEISIQYNKLRSLSVDHDHRTGRVRGLLCSKCNTALGLLDENIDKCYMLINYILKVTNNA